MRPAVFVDALGAVAVRTRAPPARPSVVAHVVDDADEAVVEHRERDAKNGVQCLDARARQPLGLGMGDVRHR